MKKLFIIASALGGTLVAGVTIGLVFPDPVRRAAKSAAKALVRGAGQITDGYQALREEMEDVKAELAREQSGKRGKTNSAG